MSEPINEPDTLMIEIPGGARPAIKAILKSQGWRWSASFKAWIRKNTPAGRKSQETIARMIRDHQKVTEGKT